MATAYGYGIAHAVEPEYRTQKARGLKALRDNGFPTPGFDVFGIEQFTNPVDATGQVSLFPNPDAFNVLVDRFVRPCPMVPRHGFVDSRPIKTVQDAEKIIAETLAAEQRAEIIAMPFINAEFSAIWTTGQLVIGPNNDGATAGKDSRMIPALGVLTSRQDCWQAALTEARITDSPYVELLWHKDYPYASDYRTMYVQLRNGPQIPDAIDYIPAKMTVENVVLADGDLLEWETKAKSFTAGTVVYHPGGSLASHYAVHAVLHNIPVVISREPIVGEVLQPNTTATKADSVKIRAGFVLGCQHDMTYQQAAFAMLVGCHSTAVWKGKADLLLGFALGCAYRLIITAALGEMRHKPGRKRRPSRDAVYTGVWNKMLKTSTRTRYLRALHSFENDNWQGAFGGQKWLEFATFAGSIYNAMLDDNVTGALELLNGAVHAAHNSGWAFNKFLKESALDETALNPSITLLKVAPELYKVIIETEQPGRITELAEWFKKRKHISAASKITKADETRALQADQTDEDTESEAVSCGCGECNCSTCNPDGDNDCSDHSCCNCYPDGCPDDDPKHCSQCYPDGCEDSECQECNPELKTAKGAKIIAAQVTLKASDMTMHIQYKTANMPKGKSYLTIDKPIASYDVAHIKTVLATLEPCNSWSGGSTKYYALENTGVYSVSTKDKTIWSLGVYQNVYKRWLVIL